MKFCQYCGREIADKAIICPGCGCSIAEEKESGKNDGLAIASKIFLILGCVTQSWLLLPLAWCLPITISIFKKINNNEPVGTGLKVCALLLVNLVGGILLLCRSDNK